MGANRVQYSHLLLAVFLMIFCLAIAACKAGEDSVIGGDTTPPHIVGAFFEGADQSSPAQGDTIKLYFDEQITVGVIDATTFALLPSGSFGTGATFAGDPDSPAAVLITLGTGPSLTIPGIFDPANPSAGPTGIDVATDLAVHTISDQAYNRAGQREPNPGIDIRGAFLPDGSAATALEVNVLTPQGEQSGNSSGHVMVQYFVADASSADVRFSVRYDIGDGNGFQTATEGTQIFASPFDPSTTGDLRIYVWDAFADFTQAGAGAAADPVTLRFIFDTGTVSDTSDDIIEEITFNLDNKPQAMPTRPYVAPASKRLHVDASDSWVPGGGTVLSDCTWTFKSVPAASTLTDSDITRVTSDPAHPLLAYFQPDVAGDYVLNLQVTTGTVSSDIALTTVHAIEPDNYVETVQFGTVAVPVERPVTPGSLALDETPGGETLVWHSMFRMSYSMDICARGLVGKLDVSSLTGCAQSDDDMTLLCSYTGLYGASRTPPADISRPVHLDTYYNGSTLSISSTNMTYLVGGLEYQGNGFLETATLGTSPTLLQSAAKADIDPEADLGISNAYIRSGRVCQVPRSGVTTNYWIVHVYDLPADILRFNSSWLVETQGDATTPYTPAFTTQQLPATDLAFDVEVQLATFGSSGPTAWVSSIPVFGGSGIYYSELGDVGTLGTLTEVTWYPGRAPGDLILDETNGYLFVADIGEGGLNPNGSIYVISLDSRTVVATLNLPGNYSIDELEIDTDTGVADTAMLFGTETRETDFSDMVHVVWVDYSGATPLLTCLPSIDAAPHPYDIVYEDARNVLYVSERDSNSIRIVQGAPTGAEWIADYDATDANSGTDEKNADWAADPTTGDLCMVFQRDANGGIFFTRSPDAGQTWSAPVLVSDSGPATAIEDPDIALDRWGTVIVVWADDRAGDLDVYMSRASDGGTNWDGSFKVNTDTDSNDQGNPCVAVDFLGNILVAFESDDGSGNVMIELVKTVGRQGWTYFGPPEGNLAVSTAGSYICADPDIALTPYPGYLSDVWVAWSDNRAATSNVMVNYTNTTYGDDGASGMALDFHGADETAIADSTAGDAYGPRIAYDGVTQTVVVVWEQDRGNGTGIYLDEGGAWGFGTDRVVEEPPAPASGTVHNPYISTQPHSGSRVVAYESDVKNPGGPMDVFWEIHRSPGLDWEGEGIRMNTDTTARHGRPLVHIYMGDNCVVIWEDERNGGTGIDFYSNRQ